MNRPNWRWVVFATALALGTDAVAQRKRNESLVDRAGWARLVVSGGRISALPVGSRDSRSTTCNNPQSACTESLSVIVEAGRASLRYQFADDAQQLTVDITRGDTVSIHREPRGDSGVAAVHFTQARDGLSLEVSADGEHRHVEASSLWQLLIVHEDLAGQHLVPILESLDSQWLLGDTVQRAEAALLRTAESDVAAQRRRCLELVEQLSDGQFEERRAAYQELQLMGPSTVALLGDLRQYHFDAEQRLRLRALRGDLDTLRGDSPDTVAALLIDDAAVWLSLVESDAADVRRTAKSQLVRLNKTAVEFEFDADADEATRQSQIDALRQRLGRQFK